VHAERGRGLWGKKISIGGPMQRQLSLTGGAKRTPGPTGIDRRVGVELGRHGGTRPTKEKSFSFSTNYCNSPIEYDVRHAEGKYNEKGSTLVFTKVTSISIHHLSSYKIYKSYHVAIVHVAEHNPPIKNKRRARNLFSCYGLHPMVTSYQATC
jgi:hypothetical protein